MLRSLCPAGSRRGFLTKAALLPVCACALAALSGCVILDEAKFKRTIDLAVPHVADAAIDVDTANGNITVLAGKASDVVITANLRATMQERADAVTVTADRDSSGKLIVRANWPEKRRNNEACSFEITLPQALGARLATSNGNIEIGGLSGQATLETSNGNVLATGHAGAITADTSNGNIILKNVGAPVKADTSNGKITVELASDATGPLELDSSNGSIDVLLSPVFVGEIHADTSNGKVLLQDLKSATVHRSEKTSASVSIGQPAGGKKSTLETSNGSITVRAPK